MSKYAISSALIAVALLLPTSIASASSSPTNQLTKTLRPVINQLRLRAGVVSVLGKSYTVKKYNFSLTLPAKWVKLTSPAGTVFAAQPTDNTNVEWLMTISKYQKQSQADTARHNLTNHYQDFGQYLKTSFQAQFPTATCILDSAKKKTIGGYIGARAVVSCDFSGTAYTFSVFAFIRKLNYYGFTLLVPQADYKTYVTPSDSIIKSLKFTK